MPTLLLPYTNISFWNCSFKMANLQRAVIDRPYSLGYATVGALYEPPRLTLCAKPWNGISHKKA